MAARKTTTKKSTKSAPKGKRAAQPQPEELGPILSRPVWGAIWGIVGLLCLLSILPIDGVLLKWLHRGIGALIGKGAYVMPFALIGIAVLLARTTPGSFVPAEDQGYLISALMLPDGATLKRTAKTGEGIRQMVSSDPAVKHTFVVSGFDLIGGGNKPNAGTMFIPLKDWGAREAKAQDLAGKFMGMGMMQPDGLALVFNPPPIMGLGSAGGFEVYLQNRVDGDTKKLHEVTQTFIAALQKKPEFTRINTFFRPTVPQLFVEVDEPKALALGIPLASVYETLQSTMGALYVNDFNKAGRVYRVQLQAEAQYRMKPDDLGKVYVRSATRNAMIPLSAISTIVTASIGWMGQFVNFIGANPIVLVFVVLPLVGFAVSILKRLLSF